MKFCCLRWTFAERIHSKMLLNLLVKEFCCYTLCDETHHGVHKGEQLQFPWRWGPTGAGIFLLESPDLWNGLSAGQWFAKGSCSDKFSQVYCTAPLSCVFFRLQLLLKKAQVTGTDKCEDACSHTLCCLIAGVCFWSLLLVHGWIQHSQICRWVVKEEAYPSPCQMCDHMHREARGDLYYHRRGILEAFFWQHSTVCSGHAQYEL